MITKNSVDISDREIPEGYRREVSPEIARMTWLHQQEIKSIVGNRTEDIISLYGVLDSIKDSVKLPDEIMQRLNKLKKIQSNYGE